MKSSDELPFEWLPKSIKPSAARRAPAFWIRDLVLLRSLDDPAVKVIRRFLLRRGLNILWAKPFRPDDPDRATDEAFAGHAAGKTLFCRCIRYLLGERHLGSEVLQNRIAATFPDGWVIATIFIEDTPWLVGRPLASKHGQFAAETRTVDDLLSGADIERAHFDVFHDALHRRVTRDLRVRDLPDRGGRINFQHLLPWLARDQEARYGSSAGWRETSSGAEPMATDNEERHFLMRTVLDLIDPSETAELDENARILRDQTALRNRLPVLKDRAETDFTRLCDGLRAEKFDPAFVGKLSLESDLLTSSVEEHLSAELGRLRQLIAEIPSADEVTRLQVALTRATERRVSLHRDVSEAETRLARTREDWGAFVNKRSIEEVKAHQRTMDMPTGYCAAPIEIATHHGCRLWREFSNLPDDEENGAKALEAVNRRFATDIQELETNLASRRHELTKAGQEESEAGKSLAAANEKRHNLFGFLSRKKATFEGLRTLAERARETHLAAKRADADLKELEDALNRSYQRQQTIRSLQNSARETFRTYFEAVCQHVLGSAVNATVGIERRTLVFETHDRGPLTSAAIETVKILALDLAALWSAIEDRSFHAAFLIHDGPREADMDPWMYRRFFTFVQKLEAAYPAGTEPAFQYIITTTEAPPEDLQRTPWLLQPPLSAQKPEDRLFRCDLR